MLWHEHEIHKAKRLTTSPRQALRRRTSDATSEEAEAEAEAEAEEEENHVINVLTGRPTSFWAGEVRAALW